jgi:hypothetical protein
MPWTVRWWCELRRPRRRGCVRAAVVACAVLIFGTISHAQISPGSLSKAHRSLSGPTQCTSCHRVGAGSANFKCLECHTEIANRIASKRGLHATFGAISQSQKECVSCHSEHNGENFAITHWEPLPGKFDHRKTGYVLEGKHAGLECVKCHTAQKIPAASRRELANKDLGHTFLGLSRDCISCHEDKHNGRLGQNCLQCHNFNEWKTVAVGTEHFDHSRTRYPLTGLHAQVACQKCHLPGADGKPKYVGLEFDRCSACHSDPHRGTMAGTCESCHNTGGWKRVSMQAVSAKFDHSKTAYPLLGKHVSVRCEACHAGADFKKPVAHTKCTDCHKPDPHNGQFIKRADRGECSGCHTVDGFKPSLFTVKEHATSAYPLQGKHASVKCEGCHIPAGRATLYKIKFAKCTDCHKDEHQTQFAAAPYFNQCEKCHTLNGYRPSTFTLARHKDSRFVLTGSHVATACNECHKAKNPLEPKAVAYRFEDRSCTACHEDPHRGQFKERMVRANGKGVTGCEVCHSTKTWTDLTRFDHSATKFPLVGTHRAVACIDCHKPPNMGVKLRDADFKAAPSACEDCHSDIHGGQFAKAKVTRCAECHNSTKWRPSLFDHEKTAFSLQGAHKSVRCAACHTNVRLVADKQILFYKPTPTRCIDCHGPAKVGGF